MPLAFCPLCRCLTIILCLKTCSGCCQGANPTSLCHLQAGTPDSFQNGTIPPPERHGQIVVLDPVIASASSRTLWYFPVLPPYSHPGSPSTCTPAAASRSPQLSCPQGQAGRWAEPPGFVKHPCSCPPRESLAGLRITAAPQTSSLLSGSQLQPPAPSLSAADIPVPASPSR